VDDDPGAGGNPGHGVVWGNKKTPGRAGEGGTRRPGGERTVIEQITVGWRLPDRTWGGGTRGPTLDKVVSSLTSAEPYKGRKFLDGFWPFLVIIGSHCLERKTDAKRGKVVRVMTYN